MPKRNPWLMAAPADTSDLRVLCFPHAGGAASAFMPWRATAPAGVDVLPVQLPGRETRMREAPPRDLDQLILDLAGGLGPALRPPFVLFGHSYGSFLAFRLALHLEATGGPYPLAVAISAARPPDLAQPVTVDALSDADLIDRLREIEGFDDALLAHEEFLAAILCTLRADLAIAEAYIYSGDATLACPLHAFGAEDDQIVAPEHLEGWRHLTGAAFTRTLYDGGHHYLRNQHGRLLTRLVYDLLPLHDRSTT